MRLHRWVVAALLLMNCYGPPGSPGIEGRQGARGAEGPQGKPSSGYRPVYWVNCGVALDIIRIGAAGIERAPDGQAETLLRYSLVVYNDGDVEVDCGAGIGTAQEGSGSGYYPEPTKGASTGGCIANADFIGNTGSSAGFWSFDVATAACPRAAYVDADNPLGLNGFSYKYSDSDCHADMLGDDGKWSPVTLSDVF